MLASAEEAVEETKEENSYIIEHTFEKFLTTKEKELFSDELLCPFDDSIKWTVHVWPFGVENGREWVSVHLCNPEKTSNKVWTSYELTIVQANGIFYTKENSDPVNYSIRPPGQGYGYVNFIRRELVEEMLIDGDLNLRARIKHTRQKCTPPEPPPLPPKFTISSDAATRTVRVKCTISEFMANSSNVIASKEIHADFCPELKWKVCLYPNGINQDSRGWLSLYLVMIEKQDHVQDQLSDTWAVVDASGQPMADAKGIFKLKIKTEEPVNVDTLEVGQGWGWTQFVTREKVSHMLIDGTLRLEGTIKYIRALTMRTDSGNGQSTGSTTFTGPPQESLGHQETPLVRKSVRSAFNFKFTEPSLQFKFEDVDAKFPKHSFLQQWPDFKLATDAVHEVTKSSKKANIDVIENEHLIIVKMIESSHD